MHAKHQTVTTVYRNKWGEMLAWTQLLLAEPFALPVSYVSDRRRVPVCTHTGGSTGQKSKGLEIPAASHHKLFLTQEPVPGCHIHMGWNQLLLPTAFMLTFPFLRISTNKERYRGTDLP